MPANAVTNNCSHWVSWTSPICNLLQCNWKALLIWLNFTNSSKNTMDAFNGKNWELRYVDMCRGASGVMEIHCDHPINVQWIIIIIITYLKKVEEWDVADSVAEVRCMFKEEHARKSSINDVRVTPWHTDQVQPFLSAVTTSKECQRRLVLPAGPGVCLNRHHFQWYSETKCHKAATKAFVMWKKIRKAHHRKIHKPVT